MSSLRVRNALVLVRIRKYALNERNVKKLPKLENQNYSSG